jgi:predicted nuclease of predicted toxin-antitoxin system
VKFLIDAMLPPEVASRLRQAGHEAAVPADLGAHNLPDDHLIQTASAEGLVIVTENVSDFAGVVSCPVVLVRKTWWSRQALAAGLSAALNRWAEENPEPGHWARWLEAKFR